MSEHLLFGILAALAGGFVGAVLGGYGMRRHLQRWLSAQAERLRQAGGNA